ncbi:MAG: hypothetical protein IBJ18_11375 [Phycisphaerales bacterium]|nr:hypothetical protein [Phycisphaerales bacterium]
MAKRMVPSSALGLAFTGCLCFAVAGLFAAENDDAAKRAAEAASGAAAQAIGGTPATAQPQSKPSIKSLAFMTGTWRGMAEGDPSSKLEEMWSEEAAGNITGAFRWVSGDKVAIVEILSITSEAEGVKLRLRHLTTALSDMQRSKDGPMVLTLTAAEERKAIFSCAKGDAAGDLDKITYDASADNGSTLRITVEFVQAEEKAGEAPKPPRKPLVLVMKKVGAQSPAAGATIVEPARQRLK